MADTFPRQQARTRRFSLGAPRSFTVSPDGSRVVFLRSGGPEDPLTGLWVRDSDSTERIVVDPHVLLAADGDGEELPAAERARRERSRETAGGVTAYSTDRDLTLAAFALSGRLWCVDLATGSTSELRTPGPVIDPRLDPTGTTVAYCSGRGLYLSAAGQAHNDTEPDWRLVVIEADPQVTWGQAEFIAAEEMGRSRGYWWAPDGSALLVARVDNSAVAEWWIADPTNPDRPPVAHRYPAAGTANALVSLFLFGTDGSSRQVDWDGASLPYLVEVVWGNNGAPLIVVESRDHTASEARSVDIATGVTELVHRDEDRHWVQHIPGLPSWLEDGQLVRPIIGDDTLGLGIDNQMVTPANLQVRSVLGVAGDTVTFSASFEPTEIEVYQWSPTYGLHQVTDSHGVATAAVGETSMVVSTRSLGTYGATHNVVKALPAARFSNEGTISSLAATPLVEPAATILHLGPRRLRVGVLVPRGHRPGVQLPVIMSPYGGPGAQVVMAARSVWLEGQWLADQGFAVVVADGRGSPGRGPTWEHAIKGDFATAVLEDQVGALMAVAEVMPDLDLSRVAIRGWSFGGYLSALAVMRRPDVFHAAIAGAPVVDWRLYDTYYTERFLGHPDNDPEAYRRSGLLDDAPGLSRPLLLVHGLVDDNVVVAHTLRLSEVLLRHGRPHEVLPLSGVTHMAAQEDVAENQLLLQVDFLRRALGITGP